MRKLAHPEKLPEIRRLYVVDKLSTRAISKKMGIPWPTVRWLVREQLHVSRNRSEAITIHHRRKKLEKKMAEMATMKISPIQHKRRRMEFICRLCGKWRPLPHLVRDPRYFPVVYCCRKCAGF